MVRPGKKDGRRQEVYPAPREQEQQLYPAAPSGQALSPGGDNESTQPQPKFAKVLSKQGRPVLPITASCRGSRPVSPVAVRGGCRRSRARVDKASSCNPRAGVNPPFHNGLEPDGSQQPCPARCTRFKTNNYFRHNFFFFFGKCSFFLFWKNRSFICSEQEAFLEKKNSWQIVIIFPLCPEHSQPSQQAACSLNSACRHAVTPKRRPHEPPRGTQHSRPTKQILTKDRGAGKHVHATEHGTKPPLPCAAAPPPPAGRVRGRKVGAAAC